MNNLKYIFLLVFTIFLSCDEDDLFPNNNCIDGEGVIVTETRNPGDFHSIHSTVYADILLTQGPLEDIIIEAQSNILEELETKVQNGELIIETDRCIDINQAITITISIPEIRSLTLTGVGNIIAQNDFSLDELDLLLTGSGNFILQGTSTTVDITLTGVGDVRSFDLITDYCNVVITGVGNAEVFVNEELNVTISGVGSVFYKGNPIVNSTITGTGNVVNAN